MKWEVCVVGRGGGSKRGGGEEEGGAPHKEVTSHDTRPALPLLFYLPPPASGDPKAVVLPVGAMDVDAKGLVRE